VTINATHTLLLAGANAIGGAFGSPGGHSGNLLVNSGGQMMLASGTLALTGGNALSISAAPARGGNGGNVTVNAGGTFTFAGGTLDLKAGTSRQAPPATDGSLILSGGTLNVATPSFNLSNGSFVFNSGTLHLTDTSAVTLTAAALHTSQAALTFNAGDALISDASLTLGATPGIVLNGGTLRAYSKALTVPSDAAFTFTAGTIDLSGLGTPPPIPTLGGATGNAGGTLNLARPLTLDANRSLLLAGGDGVPGHEAEPGNGGAGGSIVLNNGADLTLAGGTLSQAGGAGSWGRPNGADGGAGGSITVNQSAKLNLIGGTLNLGGGAGGPWVPGLGPGNPGATGAAGAIVLNGGVVNVDPSANTFTAGNFTFNTGTLHVTGAAGFTVGTSNAFNRGLGGDNATLYIQQMLIVDGTLTVPAGRSFYRGGPLAVGALAIQSGGTFYNDTDFSNTTVTNDGDFRDTLNAGQNTTVSGAGRLGSLILNAGSTATFTAGGAQQVVNLTVNTGGKATVSTGALKVGDGTAAAPLSIASDGANTGVIDVTTRGMVVDYASANEAAVLQTVRTNLTRGYHGGAWDGPGIVSSNAAADAGKAVGYALSRDVLGRAAGASSGRGRTTRPCSCATRWRATRRWTGLWTSKTSCSSRRTTTPLTAIRCGTRGTSPTTGT
jgi:hypothetical protein